MKKNKKKKTKKNRSRIKNNAVTRTGSQSPSAGGIKFNSEQVIYQRNMQALQMRYPDIARQVAEATVTNCRIVPSSSGAPNLYMTAENVYYYDQADPLRDTEEQLEALKLKNTRLAVFLGLGLGYQVLLFVKNMAKEQNTSHSLIIEKDMEIFKVALKSINLVPLLEDEKITFMIALPVERLYVEIRNYLREKSRFMFLKAMKPVYHLSALKLHKEYYLNALKQLRESGAHQVLHFGNDPKDSLIGVENMLNNLNEIISNPGINLLFDKFKKKPAVIVSTGPSLNKNKHLLKGLEKKALLIAPDASLKIMLAMGVKPHMVVALERTMGIYKMFDGLKEEDVNNVYLAACPVIDKRLYEAYPGPRIIVYRNFDHFKWLGIDKGILDIQLSAGNMAFKIAAALGCDPIILIGQDLAFAPDGNTHASGMVLGEKRDVIYERGVREVMGNDGKPILTSNVWYPFLKAYELDLANYQGTCINSTEGGAYIRGTTLMTFQEAIDKHLQEEYNPGEIIKRFLGSFTVDEAGRDLVKVLDLIKKTSSDLEEMISLCEKGLERHKQYEEALTNYLANPGQYPLQKAALTGIHREVIAPKKEIVSFYQTFQLFFMHIFQSINIKFEMEMIAVPDKHEDSLLALAELILRQAEWYQVCKDLLGVCLQSLSKSRSTLEDMTKIKKVSSSV